MGSETERICIRSCLIRFFPFIARNQVIFRIRTYTAPFLYDRWNSSTSSNLIRNGFGKILDSMKSKEILSEFGIDDSSVGFPETNLLAESFQTQVDPSVLVLDENDVTLTKDFVSFKETRLIVSGLIVLEGMIPHQSEAKNCIAISMYYDHQQQQIESMTLKYEYFSSMNLVTVSGEIGQMIATKNYYTFLERVNIFKMMNQDQLQSVNENEKEIRIDEISVKNLGTNNYGTEFRDGL